MLQVEDNTTVELHWVYQANKVPCRNVHMVSGAIYKPVYQAEYLEDHVVSKEVERVARPRRSAWTCQETNLVVQGEVVKP